MSSIKTKGGFNNNLVTKGTMISHVSGKMNFDHLSLFDAGNKNHAQIVRLLDSLKEKR